MLKTLALLAAASLVATANITQAGEVSVGTLDLKTPFAYATPPSAKVGGGYLTIANTGDAADRLVGATAKFAPTVMLHRTVVDDNGTARMEHVMGGIEIPAGEMVMLAPGGLHIMFMGLTAPIVEGETPEVTLTFEKAGDVTLPFDVLRPGTKPEAHAHSH